ncbi:MAG: hypothetical protein ACE5E8_02910 [Acidimicrobiia bacterium]
MSDGPIVVWARAAAGDPIPARLTSTGKDGKPKTRDQRPPPPVQEQSTGSGEEAPNRG